MIYVYRVTSIEKHHLKVTHIYSKAPLRNYTLLRQELKDRGFKVNSKEMPTVTLEKIMKNA